MHSSLVASPSAAAAGLVKVTRAVRLPPSPPFQDGPARPGRPSPPPALAWPRRIPHQTLTADYRRCCWNKRSCVRRPEQIPGSNTGGAGRRTESREASWRSAHCGSRGRPSRSGTERRAGWGGGRVTLQPQPRSRADPPDPDRLPMTEGRESFLLLVALTLSTGPPGRRINPGPDPPDIFHQEARVLSPTSVLLWLCGNC